MLFKNFRIIGYLRIGGLLLSMVLCVWVFFVLGYYFTSFLILLLILIQTYDLMRFVEHTNRRLQRLIESIENEDFSSQFYEDIKGDSFRDLIAAMNGVMQRFGLVKRQREEALHFLQALMDHAPVGMLVLDKMGKIEFQNRAFRTLIGKNGVLHVDELIGENAVLGNALKQMGDGDSRNIKIQRESGQENRSIRSTRFAVFGKVLTLVSIQNIASELEGRELESWQKLMRVLTHEIMNSVTPLVSLSQSAAQLVAQDEFSSKEAVLKSLQTIHRRGEGLLTFTQAYRSVAKMPQVHWQMVDIDSVFQSIKNLKEADIRKQGIELELHGAPGLQIDGDPALLEQVLINLVLNALEALEGQPNGKIVLQSKMEGNKTCIEVSDNGPGIAAEDLDRVFIPFFTTKERGSGVGLSISREIIRKMGGSLRIESEEGKGTTCIMRF